MTTELQQDSANTKEDYRRADKHFKKRKPVKRNFKRPTFDELKKQYPNIPEEIITAFSGDIKKCRLFLKKITEFSKGRHVIDISPLDVYELKNGLNAKRTALISILGMKNAETLQLFSMYSVKIHVLADYTYTKIYQGLEEMLKSLELNCYISAEKIINAGNVIKNHNGEATYGGRYIRNYLSHMIRKEKSIELSEEEKDKCLTIINAELENLSNYKHVKSFPFSIFRYKNEIRTNEDGTVLVPDVEAKYNLKRILGAKYSEAPFRKLSMNNATLFESQLIEKIRETARLEGIKNVKEITLNMPDSKIKEDLITVSNIDNVALVTGYGHVHDIIDYMIRNAKRILELEKDINKVVSDDDIQSIIQVEYTAAQSRISDIDKEMTWISELGDSLRGKNTQYGMVKGIIELGFVPKIKDLIVTYYDIDATEFLAIVESSNTAEDKKSFVEQNLEYCVK